MTRWWPWQVRRASASRLLLTVLMVTMPVIVALTLIAGLWFGDTVLAWSA